MNWGASGDEWKATLAAFLPALTRCHHHDVAEACRRWAEDQPRWPALAQLLAEVSRCQARRDPPHRFVTDDRPRATVERPIIRDPAAMRALIEDIRQHPARYAGAKALIGIGELMMERAGCNALEPA